MKQEHTREDELGIQIIGLHGRIECLKRENKELIAEFLRDWRWGRVFKKHRKSHRLKYRCICHIASWEFWKWFEEKWEKRLEESLKN